MGQVGGVVFLGASFDPPVGGENLVLSPDQVGTKCQRRGSDSRRHAYEACALPLSYSGWFNAQLFYGISAFQATTALFADYFYP